MNDHNIAFTPFPYFPGPFRIELKHSGRVLASNTQKFYSDGSSNTFHVFFDQPVQIEVRAIFPTSTVCRFVFIDNLIVGKNANTEDLEDMYFDGLVFIKK
jgi:hypothetical protein